MKDLLLYFCWTREAQTRPPVAMVIDHVCPTSVSVPSSYPDHAPPVRITAFITVTILHLPPSSDLISLPYLDPALYERSRRDFS
jgi:hypothetical protein